MALINRFSTPMPQADVLGMGIEGFNTGQTDRRNFDARQVLAGNTGAKPPSFLEQLAGMFGGKDQPLAAQQPQQPSALDTLMGVAPKPATSAVDAITASTPLPDGIPENAWQTIATIPTTGPQIPTGYIDSARASESGGNDQAANPNSSALGRYQFLDSTWNGLAQQYPELGLTPDGRTDPAQQERAMAQFTKDNASALSNAGIPVNPGTLYAAHFLGAGGAQQALTADPATPMASIVGADVIEANPQLANMTAGDFSQWAQSKGGNASGGYSAPMPYDQPRAGTARQFTPEEMGILLASEETRPFALKQLENEQQGGRYETMEMPDGSVRQVDRMTGEQQILQQAPSPTQRRIVQGPDGNQYYEDDGSRVLPGVEAPAEAADREIRTGPDGIDRYIDTGEPVFPDIAPAPAVPDFADTTKLRTEIQQLPSYKNIAQALPIYRSMQEAAGRNTKASDLNLVYGLGKIFDPTSVVREGEMVLVQNTASLPDWLQGAIASLNGGAALTPETRAAIMQEAYGRVQGYDTAFRQDTTQYQDIAGRNNLNPADIIPDFGDYSPWSPEGGGAPITIEDDAGYDALPPGTQFIGPDGQLRVKQ